MRYGRTINQPIEHSIEHIQIIDSPGVLILVSSSQLSRLASKYLEYRYMARDQGTENLLKPAHANAWCSLSFRR